MAIKFNSSHFKSLSTLIALCITVTCVQTAIANPSQVYGSVQPHPVLDANGNETNETIQTTLLSTSDAEPLSWLSSSDGVNLYSDPACENIIGTANFLEEFFQVWESVEVVLLAKSNAPKADPSIQGSGNADRIAGYAKKLNFVRSKPTEPAYYCQTSDANISLKALTVHKWEDNEASESAKVLNAPSESAEVLDEISLYEINYVYLTYGKDKTDPSRAEYYLVGRKPYVMRGTDEINDIRGWVSGKRIFNWDHRQAIEFNKDEDALAWRSQNNQPIRFYSSIEDAESSKDESYEEDLNAGKWPHYRPRYPIISTTDTDPVIIEAGVIGDSYTGDRTLTSTDEARLQNLLEEAQQATSNVDVLLVVDATGSMNEFYSSIGLTIDKLQAAVENNGLTARYAVSYFRDYTEDEITNSWSHYYQDFRGSSEFRELFNPASNSFVPSGGGNDDPCTFAGLINGMNSVSWDPDSTRVVILVGDMGNTTSKPTSTFESKLTVDPEIEQFMAADANGNDLNKVKQTMNTVGIDVFFAIQTRAAVINSPGSMGLNANDISTKYFIWRLKEFNNQSRLLQQALGMEDIVNVIDSYSSNLGSQLEDAIGTAGAISNVIIKIQQALKEGKSIDEAVDEYGTAGIDTSMFGTQTSANYQSSQWGLYIKDKALEKAEQQGVDVANLMNNRVQMFAFAFAPQNIKSSPYPQLKTTILMTKGEAESLISTLAIIERRSMTADNVDRIWRGIINSLIGEYEDSFTFDETKPLSEYFSKSLGIPARSIYLSKSIRELKSLTPQEIADWNVEIKERIQALRNYINDKSIDGTGTEKHIFTKNGFEYAYIPIELFP